MPLLVRVDDSYTVSYTGDQCTRKDDGMSERTLYAPDCRHVATGQLICFTVLPGSCASNCDELFDTVMFVVAETK